MINALIAVLVIKVGELGANVLKVVAAVLVLLIMSCISMEECPVCGENTPVHDFVLGSATGTNCIHCDAVLQMDGDEAVEGENLEDLE